MNIWDEISNVHNEIENCKEKNLKIVNITDSDTEHEAYGYKWDNKSAPDYLTIIGCSHGNEPIGIWFCINLLKQILNSNNSFLDNINMSLFIIPVLDVEIAQKNSHWINHEFNYKEYLKYGYLNPVFEQLEFSYPSNKEIIQNIVIRKLDEELKKTKTTIILSCHQTPSIYGGYYYTNISNEKIHKEMQYLYLSKGIPIEILPQGIGVQSYANGVFGKFSSLNLGQFHNEFKPLECSQTYFNDILKVPYIVPEIPFGYSLFLYNKTEIGIKEYLTDIFAILDASNRLIDYLDNNSRNEDFSLEEQRKLYRDNSGYYWLKSFQASDRYMVRILSTEGNIRKHDFCQIVRQIFYKAQFVGMLTGNADTKVKLEAQSLLEQMNNFLSVVFNVIDINWINPKLGIQLLYNCLGLLIKNKDDLYGASGTHI